MHLYEPTNKELQDINWKSFMTWTRKDAWLITTDQWREILVSGVLKDTLLNRLQEFFALSPYIGFSDEGLIVIYTGDRFKWSTIDNTITWVTNVWFATYDPDMRRSTEKTTLLTVDTTAVITENMLKSFLEFWGLTTDDMSNVPMMFYEHNTDRGRSTYIYSNGNLHVVPLPDGAEHIKQMKLLRGNKTNAIEVIDHMNRPHSGVIKMLPESKKVKVEYDPVTIPETVPKNLKGRTSI
jgi:hypothetical protein